MIESFNKDWFLISESGEKTPIDVPLDLMLFEKRDKDSLNGDEGSYFFGGKYHYQKSFTVKESELNDYFALHFHGVYKKATVIINGEIKAIHENGFSDFYIEFKPSIINTIDLIADNTLIPNCRWYTGSGIYRDVELIHKKRNEIKNVFVKTLDYKKRKIEILVDTDENYFYQIYEGNNLIYESSEKVIELKELKLWDINNPVLYQLKVKTCNDEEIVKFGVRQVELIPHIGLLLNGERIILKGACLHSDNEFLGAASFKDIEYKKVKILKENGFNAIRCAHNPASTLFLNVCDELGMLVIDEAFDGRFIPKNYHDISRKFNVIYEDTIKMMVKKDLNHPSVIMYSFGNELSEIATEKGLNLLKKMNHIVKTIDTTRLTTCGVNLLIAVYYKFGIGVYKDKKKYEEKPLADRKSGYKEKKNGSSFFNAMVQHLGSLMFLMSKSRLAGKVAKNVSEIVDIIGLNYGTPRYKIDSKKYPSRLMYGSETMIKDIKINYESSSKYPNVIGDFIWSGIDYLGEASSNDYRYYSYHGLPLLSGAGCIDFSYKKTAEMEYIQTIWEKKIRPTILLSPVDHYFETPKKSAWRFTNSIASYNFQGYENKPCEVEIYSAAYKVELLINDKSIGIKKFNNCIAKFKTKYQSGLIKAIAFDRENNIIDASTMISGKKIIFNVELSKKALSISNGDITIIEMEFIDENGYIYPTIETPISVETSSNLKLIGLGSAITATNESYKSNTFKTYRGRLVGLVKAIDFSSKIGEIIINNQISGEKIITVEVKQ